MFKSYLELTKPERTLANVIMAIAGFLLGSKWQINLTLFTATIIGLTLIVASACVLNNYIDRDLDKKMTRTRKRLLATGIISPRSGLIFSILLGITGFLILILKVNTLVVILGVIAYLDYIVLYGVGKRRSKYGTLIGTVCGSLPIVAGYCATTDKFDRVALILFLSMIFWQMAHFYAIAIFRLKDYTAAGLPVWPAVKSVYNTKVHIIKFIAAFLISTVSLSAFGPTGYVYAVVMFLIGVAWLAFAINGWRSKNDSRWARAMFMFSLKVLLVYAFMISIGAVLP
jgi:heme o synthase